MHGFRIVTDRGITVHFEFYTEIAPITTRAFFDALPFSCDFYHAKVSGDEIWTDRAPSLEIPQENASVFAEIGEVAIGPAGPTRNRIRGCMGIFYGQGKLLDAGNIFAKVKDSDLQVLQSLGNSIWQKGGLVLHFEPTKI